jgi:hypothetical protein
MNALRHTSVSRTHTR